MSAVDGCQNEASIMRRHKPLCGEHRLKRLEHEMAEGQTLPLNH